MSRLSPESLESEEFWPHLTEQQRSALKWWVTVCAVGNVGILVLGAAFLVYAYWFTLGPSKIFMGGAAMVVSRRWVNLFVVREAARIADVPLPSLTGTIIATGLTSLLCAAMWLS